MFSAVRWSTALSTSSSEIPEKDTHLLTDPEKRAPVLEDCCHIWISIEDPEGLYEEDGETNTLYSILRTHAGEFYNPGGTECPDHIADKWVNELYYKEWFPLNEMGNHRPGEFISSNLFIFEPQLKDMTLRFERVPREIAIKERPL